MIANYNLCTSTKNKIFLLFLFQTYFIFIVGLFLTLLLLLKVMVSKVDYIRTKPSLTGRYSSSHNNFNFNERANCSLPCNIKKKGNTGKRMRILMSFKKFTDCQKDSPCAVSSYMEDNSCK